MEHSLVYEPIAVTYGGAAQLTGLTERRLKRLVAEGALPACRIGRSVRIFVRDLEAFLEAGRRVECERDEPEAGQ